MVNTKSVYVSTKPLPEWGKLNFSSKSLFRKDTGLAPASPGIGYEHSQAPCRVIADSGCFLWQMDYITKVSADSATTRGGVSSVRVSFCWNMRHPPIAGLTALAHTRLTKRNTLSWRARRSSLWLFVDGFNAESFAK